MLIVKAEDRHLVDKAEEVVDAIIESRLSSAVAVSDYNVYSEVHRLFGDMKQMAWFQQFNFQAWITIIGYRLQAAGYRAPGNGVGLWTRP